MFEFTYKRLDKNDVAVLLVDPQTGLLSLVKDFGVNDFKSNVLALVVSQKPVSGKVGQSREFVKLTNQNL